jgi:hypothetical protein
MYSMMSAISPQQEDNEDKEPKQTRYSPTRKIDLNGLWGKKNFKLTHYQKTPHYIYCNKLNPRCC